MMSPSCKIWKISAQQLSRIDDGILASRHLNKILLATTLVLKGTVIIVGLLDVRVLGFIGLVTES